MKVKTKLTLAGGLLMLPLLACAKSLYITGSIETISPKLSISYPEPVYQGVKSYVIEGLTAPNSGCDLETNEYIAQQDDDTGRTKCFFEWTSDTDPSWQASALTVSGRAMAEPGSHTRAYQVSYFNGSAKEKVVIQQGEIDYTIEQAQTPIITNLRTRTSSRIIDGYSLLTHDPKETLRELLITVEPRPYDQLVSFTQLGVECTVPEGSDWCQIPFSAQSIAVDDEQLEGTLMSEVTISDPYGYLFGNSEQIAYAWDFRPPVIEQFALKAVGENSTKEISIEVDGTTIELENNEAVIVISSPHSADQDDTWWMPPTLSMNFEKHKDHVPVRDFVTLEGRAVGSLFQKVEGTYIERDVDSTGVPQKIGDYYVYRVKLNNVNDGLYQGGVSAKDIYGNTGLLNIESMLLDRLPPEIRIYNVNREFSSGDPINFIEHLVLTVQDQSSINNEITEVWLDGEPVEHIGEHKMAKAIRLAESLVSNTVHELIINAKDENENFVQRKYQLAFLPLNYTFSNVASAKVALVQNQDISFNQIQGPRCRLFRSDQEATLAIRQLNQTNCSVKWERIPDGLEVAIDTTNPELIGAFNNTGAETIRASIYIHDMLGRTNLVKEDEITLLVGDPDTPEIIFDERGMFSNGIYAVEMGESRVGRYRIRAASSPVYVTLKRDGQVLQEMHFRQSDRYRHHNIANIINDRNIANHRRLWEENEYSLEVRYSRLPQNVTTAAVKSFAVPSSRVRAQIFQDSKEVSNKQTMDITAKFGLYDSFYRELKYLPEQMGEWQIRIAAEGEDKQTIGLTDWVDLDNSGANTFDVNFVDKTVGSVRFFAQAKVISPNPDYEQWAKSSRGVMKVLKGTAIEGDLRTTRITGSVPLNASITYEFDSRDDRDAATTVNWFTSTDNGATWTPYGTSGTRFSYRADQEGTWLVKAKVANRMSGEVSETDQVQIMAYKIPQIEMEGPNNLIKGMTRTYTLLDGDAIADDGNLLIKWSLDGGDTWADGGSTLEYTADEIGARVVMAKAAYLGFESDEKSWNSDYIRVNTQKDKPVRAQVRGGDEVETGDTLELSAYVRAPYTHMDSEITVEWEMPDGSVQNGETLLFTPTMDDLNRADIHEFKLRSWISDAKEQTYTETKHRVQVWEYHFPQFGVAYTQRIKVAPSVIDIWLRRPISVNLNEEFKYDWSGEGRLELTKEYGYRARFTAKQPGLYPISVVVEDDRGNTDTFIEYVEVLEPEPISMELTPRFSNRYQRSPLNVNMRPTIRGGHPRDRVSEYRWYVDGELVANQERSTANIENLLEGEHEIKLAITTMYGQEANVSFPVEVIPNTPPLCTVDYSLFSKTARIEAKCSDSDGKIVRYNWKVDGRELSNVGKRISELRQPGEIAVVEVTGIDDSGDSATATIQVVW
ncbi:Ig-like domain-containing protein (plasmid) [Vibrio scophthalmi]|uniref:Ig-like domain-containing protein n=1 Tax=Vibrio scophthalmi TaxID=45658 RepID=UPI003EBAE89A